MTSRRRIERRPGGRAVDVPFPAGWIERFGEPPRELRARRAWIVACIRSGVPRGNDKPEARYLERRSLPAPALPALTCQAREAVAGGNWIGGLLVPFGKRSLDLGGFHEVFDPHAFDIDSRGGWADVTGHWAHRWDALLGTVKARTLRLQLSHDGIHYELEPPRSGLGPYVAELVERGDVHGASLGFIELAGDWDLDEQGMAVRTVREAVLLEASVVASPAYEQTTAAIMAGFGRALAVPRKLGRLALVGRELDVQRHAMAL